VHNYGVTDRVQVKVDLLVGKARPEPEDGKPDGEPFSLKIQQQLLVDIRAFEAAPSLSASVHEPGRVCRSSSN